MRSIPEWIGRTDDSMPPPSVRLRIYDRYKGRCAHCGNKVLPAEYDHITPLRDGGANAEGNFQILCRPCHSAKTSSEATERAKVDRIKAKHLGIKPAKRGGFRRWRKFNGTIVERGT